MTTQRFQSLLLSALLLFGATHASAARKDDSQSLLASTPPLGWNSWDSFGLTVTAEEWKRNVDWLHEHLQPAGYQYVVVDEGWYLAHPEAAGTKGADQGYTLDANGRYTPATERFPDGLKGLADYAHSLGLQFGIHIVRGIPKEAVEKNLPIEGGIFHAADAADTHDTCQWNPDNYGVRDNAAGQAYYDSVLRLYASWGVDFLKVDCISSPYNTHEIREVHAAIEHAGRPVVLSLSPGPTPLAQAADATANSNLWRISNDIWDVWADSKTAPGGFPQPVSRQFDTLASWAQYAGPGHWPDADMLPLGYLGPRPGWGAPRVSRLTYDEARTMVTLWSIARSPLILGTNLPQMDPLLEQIVTNREVLFVDQQGRDARRLDGVGEPGKCVVWRSEEPKGGKRSFFAVFNLGDSSLPYAFTWKQLGLKHAEHRVRDLWLAEERDHVPSLTGTLPPHGAALFRVD